MNYAINTFLLRFHDYKDVDDVFQKGCCYWFSVILHTRFPNSRIMYDQVSNHFVTEIDDRLYDITGDVTEKYDVVPWEEYTDTLHKSRVIRDCIMF